MNIIDTIVSSWVLLFLTSAAVVIFGTLAVAFFDNDDDHRHGPK